MSPFLSHRLLSNASVSGKKQCSYYCHKSLLDFACTIESKTVWWTQRIKENTHIKCVEYVVALLKSCLAPKLPSITYMLAAVQLESDILVLFQQQKYPKRLYQSMTVVSLLQPNSFVLALVCTRWRGFRFEPSASVSHLGAMCLIPVASLQTGVNAKLSGYNCT